MKNYYNYIIRNETIYSDVVIYKKIRTYFAQNITYGIPPLASFKILVSDKIVVIFCGWTQFSVKGVERIDCWQMVKTCSFHNRMLSYSKSNESMEFFKQKTDIKDSQWHLFQTCNLKNGSSYIDCNRISFFNMVYVIFEFFQYGSCISYDNATPDIMVSNCIARLSILWMLIITRNKNNCGRSF